MTIEEARQILRANRPERPSKTESRRLQAAIDTILEYQSQLDRWKSVKADNQMGMALNGEDIVFYEGILHIIKEGETKANEVILTGEYSRGISLADIRKKKGKIVIFENANNGIVYRYGNHGEFWEKVGYTIGFA